MARTGQFKKGGGRVGGAPSSGGSRRKSKRRSPAKGLTIVEKVSSPAPVVKVVHVPTAMAGRAPARRGGGGKGQPRHHRSEHSIVMKAHGAGEMVPGPFRLRSAAISGMLGYADGGKGLTAIKDLLDKIPSVGKLPKEILVGAAMNYFADRGDWFDAGAQAFLDVGAYKLGQAGFALSGLDDDDNY